MGAYVGLFRSKVWTTVPIAAKNQWAFNFHQLSSGFVQSSLLGSYFGLTFLPLMTFTTTTLAAKTLPESYWFTMTVDGIMVLVFSWILTEFCQKKLKWIQVNHWIWHIDRLKFWLVIKHSFGTCKLIIPLFFVFYHFWPFKNVQPHLRSCFSKSVPLKYLFKWIVFWLFDDFFVCRRKFLTWNR